MIPLTLRYGKSLNDYKNLLDSKRKEFQKEKTEQLGELTLNPDKASFWSCLKSISDTVDDNVPAPILEKTWLNYFESLHSNDPKNPIYRQEFYNEMQSLEKEREQRNLLDYQIAEQETCQAVEKLKNKKSAFLTK